MKTLQKMILAAALSGCISSSVPGQNQSPYVPTPSTTVPRCWAPDAYLGLLNEEVTEAIYKFVAVPICVDVEYDNNASGRFGVVMSSQGPIYLDQQDVYFPEDVMFSLLAHEYGHVFYHHPEQQAYISFISGNDPCVDAAAMRDMELQADMLSGSLTAITGRPAEPFIDFISSLQDTSMWMPICMQDYYPTAARLDAFSQSYQAAKAMGF